jgi:hypothetical protein
MGERRSEDTRGRSGQGELWAALVPGLCALHCLAVPVIVLFLPAFQPDPRIERVVMLVAAVLAAGLLGWGVRAHRRVQVWIPAVLGFSLWSSAALSGAHGRMEIALELAGAALVAAALIWSAWLRHQARCGACGCPAHEEISGSDAAVREAGPEPS